MKNKDYKSYSYDQLLAFEKQGPDLVEKLKNQADKKNLKINNLKSKLDGVEQNIKKVVEKSIGQKPGSEINKFYDSLSDENFKYFFGTCYVLGFLQLYINVNLPLILSLLGALILIGPAIGIGIMMILIILQNIFEFIVGGDAIKKYQKRYDKKFSEIKKNKYYQSIKSTQNQIDSLENEKDKIENEYITIEKALYEIVSLKRKAKGKEDRAKIAAFNNKARSAASYVRASLLKEILNKKKWECPYCHETYDIGNKNYTKLLDADHIHPVHKGGLSTKQNMILVCKSCNSKKKTLTLRQFCKIRKFDYEKTCNVLEKMGKDI